jgi:hypothetical protein
MFGTNNCGLLEYRNFENINKPEILLLWRYEDLLKGIILKKKKNKLGLSCAKHRSRWLAKIEILLYLIEN